MSAFIVISVKDNLNWIVDGIKECRPHNPNVVTYLSTGKINKKENDKYLYEYTSFSKHDGNDNTNNIHSNVVESNIPRNLFSNQIAQFLNVCENEGEQINIFLLDNPITDADFEQSSWLIDEIRAVHESHKVTNFQLVRVLFTYQLDSPTDVNMQVSRMILKQLTRMEIEESDNFLTRILYVDNQNRNGAAICVNKREHDMMIPRMLNDFMMLISNKDDSYNVSAAISGQTNMFAVGYSECMYYHDDVFRYYKLASKRDLLQFLLEAKNSEESLDYDRFPIGLRDRLNRLKGKYTKIPFNQDISLFKTSIDKAIDDILQSFKKDIEGIREEAILTAKIKDAEETKKLLINHLKSTRLVPENVDDEDLDNNYESIAKEVGIDVGLFEVTTETENAKNEFPKYIDRHQIYEEHLLEDEEDNDLGRMILENNVKAYNRLLSFIQTKTFKTYVRRMTELSESMDETSMTNNTKKPQKECFLRRLFKCKKKTVVTTEETRNMEPTLKRNWHLLRDSLASISKMNSARESYQALGDKITTMEREMVQLNDDIQNFKLTSHCSSVDNLIDLDKLKEYHASGRSARLNKIVEMWNSRSDTDKTYNAFFDDLNEKTKWDLFDFYYIKWSEPFPFVKAIDLERVCDGLLRRSQPFVNTYTLSPNSENLTSYNLYTDNERWYEDISQKRIKIKYENKVSCTESCHICSKICMFQFLQMNQDLIEGLVDCYEDDC